MPTTRCVTVSHTVTSAKTDRAIARIVESDIPSPGTHSATAEMPMMPVTVPTAQRTGTPSVKCTAENALRRHTSQTPARSAEPAAASAEGPNR